MRYNLTPNKVILMKKMENTKYCCCKCKMVQPVWKTVWWSFIWLKIQFQYHPAILLLDLHPKETKAYVYPKSCSRIFLQLYLSSLKGFPDNSVGKESACKAGDPSSSPGSGRCPGEGKGYPFQYSSLENSTDYIVHGVTKSRTQLNNFLHILSLP